jgi:hypothetical protein
MIAPSSHASLHTVAPALRTKEGKRRLRHHHPRFLQTSSHQCASEHHHHVCLRYQGAHEDVSRSQHVDWRYQRTARARLGSGWRHGNLALAFKHQPSYHLNSNTPHLLHLQYGVLIRLRAMRGHHRRCSASNPTAVERSDAAWTSERQQTDGQLDRASGTHQWR